MSNFDFIEYRLKFKQSLNLKLSVSREKIPILYSDWLYRVFESGWQRLHGEDFPYDKIRISSGFPYYKEDSQCLFYHPELNDYVSVVRDKLSAGEIKFGLSTFRVFNRPRAEFNRKTGRRDKRFSTVEIHFKENAGIWFGTRFKDENLRDKFESVIRFIGDEGIGGGRSTGYGSFELTEINEVSVYKEEASAFVSLSRFVTPEETEIENLYSEIRPMHVAIKEPDSDEKKVFPIFGEGSVLNDLKEIEYTEFGKFIGADNPKAQKVAFLFLLPVPSKIYKLQSK